MKISVKGKNAVLTKKETRYLVNFLAKILVGERLAKHMFVEIIYTELPHNVVGLCSPTDWESKLPRDFEIFVDPAIDRKKQIKTIAHEMVHVMQFARGHFKILDEEDRFKWMGKYVNYTRKQYKKMPWEKEAMLSERYLYKFYKKHLENNGLTF